MVSSLLELTSANGVPIAPRTYNSLLIALYLIYRIIKVVRRARVVYKLFKCSIKDRRSNTIINAKIFVIYIKKRRERYRTISY